LITLLTPSTPPLIGRRLRSHPPFLSTSPLPSPLLLLLLLVGSPPEIREFPRCAWVGKGTVTPAGLGEGGCLKTQIPPKRGYGGVPYPPIWTSGSAHVLAFMRESLRRSDCKIMAGRRVQLHHQEITLVDICRLVLNELLPHINIPYDI